MLTKWNYGAILHCSWHDPNDVLENSVTCFTFWLHSSGIFFKSRSISYSNVRCRSTSCLSSTTLKTMRYFSDASSSSASELCFQSIGHTFKTLLPHFCAESLVCNLGLKLAGSLDLLGGLSTLEQRDSNQLRISSILNSFGCYFNRLFGSPWSTRANSAKAGGSQSHQLWLH